MQEIDLLLTTMDFNFTIRKLKVSDASSLLNIMNYYVLNTFADFSDKPHNFSDIKDLVNTSKKLPKYVAEIDGQVIGFALAYPFRPESTFANTVKFTYWINPSYTSRGIGSRLYDCLESACRQNNIKNILVNISSENKGSIKFHEKRGFIYCGHFKQIACKLEKCFDMIWLQKSLTDE